MSEHVGTGTASGGRDPGRRGWSWLVLVPGFVLVALNLRPAIAGVAPLLDRIMTGVGLTPLAGGLITTVMVACLGVVAPLAPALAGRLGLDRALWVALVLLAAGAGARPWPLRECSRCWPRWSGCRGCGTRHAGRPPRARSPRSLVTASPGT